MSRTILSGGGKVKWAVREEPQDPRDTGWRFFAADDDADFLNAPGNVQVADYNTVIGLDPAVLGIYSMPVGTDLQLVAEPGGPVMFIDNLTGNQVTPPPLQ